jgi:hypothetical protein
MPVAPCFDPTTGASGGAATGGGGGADLSALGFTQIDLTSGFTLTDPDSLVSATTNTGGTNKVVFNALGSGSTDYAWGAGSNQRAPRWTKNLTATDSTGGEVQIKSGDTFILQTVVEFATPDNRYATEVVVASSADGTATAAASNDAMGGLIRYNASGNIQYGIFTFNGYNTQASASNDRGVCTVLHSGSRGQGGAYVNLDSSGDAITGGSRNASMNYTDATTDMRLMVGVGTNGSATIGAGDDAQFKAWFRVVKFTLPS